jgi:hypothetical protein
MPQAMTRAVAIVLAGCLLPACAADPQEHLARGKMFLEQKKHREAVVELRTAVQANPSLAAVQQFNPPQIGVPSLEASASELPGNGDVHFHLGTAYARNGEPARGRTALTLGLNPDDETAARTLLSRLDSARG